MLHKDGKRAGALWWSDHVSNLTPIKSMYIGSTLVWDAGGDRPVVDIVGSTTQTSARNQMRAAVAGYGLDYQTVETLPFDVRFVESTNATNAFNGFSKLTVSPKIYAAPGELIEARSMYRNCRSLEFVGDINTGGVVEAREMFLYNTSLLDGAVRLIGKHPNVSTGNMLYGSGLTREPFYDTDGNPI